MAKFGILLGTFMVFGCGAASLDTKIANSAAKRWDCPESQVKVEQLDGDTYRVTGCNREADYACRDTRGRSDKVCDRVSGF